MPTTGVCAVLFDAVGTLIYPDPPVADAYYAAGQRFGSTRTLQEIRERFHWAFARQDPSESTSEEVERRRWQAIVAHVFDDLSDTREVFETLWQHFAESRHWRVFDDVAGTWRDLSTRGLVLGIASNFDARLDALCDGLPPLAGCSRRFVSSRVGYHKPSRRFFRAVEQSLELNPTQLLLVGDDYENDYLGAQAAGWRSILISRKQPRLDVPQPYQLRSLDELLSAIDHA